MSTYRHRHDKFAPPGPAHWHGQVDAGRLWRGGVVAALAAVAVAIAGFIVVRSVLELPILGVTIYDGVSEPSVAVYALVAALGAFAATAMAHMLVLGTPEPLVYFRWVMVLCTMLAMLLPVLASEDTETGYATAAVNLAIGLVIWVVVGLSVRFSRR